MKCCESDPCSALAFPSSNKLYAYTVGRLILGWEWWANTEKERVKVRFLVGGGDGIMVWGYT